MAGFLNTRNTPDWLNFTAILSVIFKVIVTHSPNLDLKPPDVNGC